MFMQVAATKPITPASDSWKNPAAAAALHSSVDMLTSIERGMERNFSDVSHIRSFVSDLHSATDVLTLATDALTNDGEVGNDSFLPLVTRASTNVAGVEARLASKEIVSTWPSERTDILAAIRQARTLSFNVAKQLDPTAGA
jgi:hypothetical protein